VCVCVRDIVCVCVCERERRVCVCVCMYVSIYVCESCAGLRIRHSRHMPRGLQAQGPHVPLQQSK
jgi:hypothetical protein